MKNLTHRGSLFGIKMWVLLKGAFRYSDTQKLTKPQLMIEALLSTLS